MMTQGGGGILPEGYIQKEYLYKPQQTASAKPFIDLDYTPFGDEVISFTTMIDSFSSGTYYLQFFGSRAQGVATSSRNCWLGMNGSTVYARFGTVNPQSQNLQLNTSYDVVVDLNNKFVKFNNITLSFPNSTISPLYSIRLFAIYSNSDTLNTGTESFYIKDFVAKRNGVDVVKLVSCVRSEDNVVGCYDVIRNVFFPKEGTGVLNAL